MNLTLPEIPDSDLRDFIELLRQENLHDIVVVGGAVRDLLLSQPCKDIDIAVRLQIQSPELVQETNSNGPYDMIPALADVLRPLAAALGHQVCSLYEPLPFRSLTVDTLGLRPIKDLGGQIYPDIFVDVNERVFNTRPELTVNQLVLSTEAKVWPVSGVQDLNNRMGRLTEAPLGIHLRQALRALRTCKQFNLTLTPESAQKILAHLLALQDPRLFEKELFEEDTQQLFGELTNAELVKAAGPGMSGTLTAITSLIGAYSNAPPRNCSLPASPESRSPPPC